MSVRRPWNSTSDFDITLRYWQPQKICTIYFSCKRAIMTEVSKLRNRFKFFCRSFQYNFFFFFFWWLRGEKLKMTVARKFLSQQFVLCFVSIYVLQWDSLYFCLPFLVGRTLPLSRESMRSYGFSKNIKDLWVASLLIYIGKIT